MGKLRNILLNTKVIILILCLVFGLVALYPNPWNKGVIIKSVAKNSAAELAGIEAPKAKLSPMAHEHVLAINNKVLADLQSYHDIIDNLKPNQTIKIKTDKKTYDVRTRPLYKETILNETEIVEVNETIQINETREINGTNQTILVNKTITKEEERPIVLKEVIGVEPIGLGVAAAPTTNLKKGLDLQGGTRVVLKPEGEDITQELLDDTVSSIEQRLNVYGLSDLQITQVSDSPEFLGGGTRYILVEIAGLTPEDLKGLFGDQGKFEAKIAKKTVFLGGDKDIKYVCRTSQCSGIDPRRGCDGSASQGYKCPTYFQITLSPEAADRWAAVTKDIPIVGDALSEEIVLYLDDNEVERLSVARGLRGQAATNIQITGGGSGQTMEAAINDALKNMKRMQTILKTGSLPIKLNIDRIDEISPTLGEEFLKNAFIVGLLSLVAVTIVLVIRYRKFIIAIPILITAISEIFLTLGIAALIGWNIDLAAIAGIILAVGTGVNDQIIITDEAIGKESDKIRHWKDKIKRAFFIIMSAYFTTAVAMIPLFFAGAGLLKGFALTTLLAITVGVFVTRPAFAAIIQYLVEE